MDTDFMAATVSEAHPETMDFLSHAWCNFAVRAFQPEKLQDQSIIPTKSFYNNTKSPILMENHIKMEDADMKSLPPLQSNDLKSWIWMQQAMHPELNYNGFFQKKWLPWKTMPLKNLWSIKKWAKEMKEKRKEGKRMQRAEVHAAISIAGLAAALAAIAAEKSKGQEQNNNSKEIAVASAAALVAAQCAQVAESMGAERQQLSSTIGSAMTGTSTTDILTLTAAATTSLRGAAILKARSGYRNRLNESALVQPIEDSNDNSNFEKCRSVLAKSVKLTIETSEGKRMVRLASLHQNKETKVILKIRKVNLLNVITGKEECVVLDLHAELYRSTQDNGIETCYQIVLTTTRGIIKLDMGDDHQRYKMWSTTIHHMLLLSKSLTTYELQFSKY